MKNLFTILFFALVLVARVSAADFYQQDWSWAGSDKKSLADYGWSQVLPPSGFVGNYEEASANENESNDSLPTSAIYFGGEKAATGFFYITNGAAAKSGGAVFKSIDLKACLNLTFTIEAQHSWQGTNLTGYFAIQSGDAWYVATNHPIAAFAQDAASGTFQKFSLVFNSHAVDWTSLNPVTATLGKPADADISSSITGVGVFMKLTDGGSWDFNKFTITSNPINKTPVAKK